MGEKRLYGDASGLTTFWFVAGVGTAMLAGHIMYRAMQRMAAAGTPDRMMAKGPFGAFGWMFEAPATPAPAAKAAPKAKPAPAPKADVIDAEIVAPAAVTAKRAARTAKTAAETAVDEAVETATETAQAAAEAVEKVVAPKAEAAAEVVEKAVAPQVVAPKVEAGAEVVETAVSETAEAAKETVEAVVAEPVEAERVAEPETPAEPEAKAEPETQAEPEAKAEPEAAPARPTALDAPRGEKDDLKRIKGVGPKLEAVLNRLGYFHFDQIAAWGPEELARVDESLDGFAGRATRDDWIGQAKLLGGGVH